LVPPIEWLQDNGSPYTTREARALARKIGLVSCTTPIESPQSSGMAEAFVKTLKRRLRTGQSATRRAPRVASTRGLVERYNTIHPRKGLGY
jgi:putative transposase